MHFVFIENRKGISQIFPNIEEFIQFFFFLAKLCIKIQLHPFWLKQVIWQNALLDLIRAMFMKMAVTKLIMGLSEKLFRLHYPQTPLYQISLFHTSQRAQIEWVKESNIFYKTIKYIVNTANNRPSLFLFFV